MGTSHARDVQSLGIILDILDDSYQYILGAQIVVVWVEEDELQKNLCIEYGDVDYLQ